MKKIVIYTLEAILFVAALVGLDQYTKYLAATILKNDGPVVIIDKVFELNYLENRGAAFGILQNQQVFFLIVSLLFIIVALYLFYTVPFEKKYLPFKLAVLAIMSGGIGNMIDRISLKYVVDFLYFKAIDFPVFNVADCYVTVSAVVIAVLILFVYKDDDLNRMFKFKKRKADNRENE